MMKIIFKDLDDFYVVNGVGGYVKGFLDPHDWRVIYINARLSTIEKFFVIIHELFHFVLEWIKHIGFYSHPDTLDFFWDALWDSDLKSAWSSLIDFLRNPIRIEVCFLCGITLKGKGFMENFAYGGLRPICEDCKGAMQQAKVIDI